MKKVYLVECTDINASNHFVVAASLSKDKAKKLADEYASLNDPDDFYYKVESFNLEEDEDD